MAAFKPNQRSALAVAEDPQTREDFEAIFGKDMVSQCERIFHESLEQVHQRQAFFRERRIVDTAVREANKELPTKVLRHQHFEPLLQWFFRSQPWVALDTRGTVTTQEMWDKERRMLAMAGERTSAHLIPEEVVDEALATRTWVERGSLPEGFLKTLLENYPNLSNPKEPIEVRMVLNTARQLGQEVFGSDLTWNREGATTLKPEDVGASGEFLAALEDAEKEGENWFQKAALFISDDWSAEDAKRLKEKALDSGFPMVFAARTGISDEQTEAVVAATLIDKRVTVIEGTAGAGKSFTMKSVYEAYMAMGYDVMGAALGWSAAKVLSGSTGLPNKSCKAMTGFLNSIRRAQESGSSYFNKKTLIIVDEAGMVGTRYMHDLLEMTRNSPYPVKIVLTGDSLQVAPVDAGNALEAIVITHGTTRINTIRRQKQASHRESVYRFSQKRSGEALHAFIHQESIQWATDKEDLFNKVVRDFVSYQTAFPEKKALILALENKDVNELNRRIRLVHKKAGLIAPEEVLLKVTDGSHRPAWQAGFSIGDEVVLRSNDQDLPTYHIPPAHNNHVYDSSSWEFKDSGVFNRNAGKIVGISYSNTPPGSVDFIIDLDGEEPARVVVNSKKFKHDNGKGMPMVHNFATTIYASQGQTVNKVIMLDSPNMNFRLGYVGASRHTESLDIYLNETELHMRIDRKMGLSPSKNTKDVDPDKIKVELGRYSREEMLRTMALGWGQDAENLTATIFHKRAKAYQQKKEPTPAERSVVRMASPNDVVVDFIPSLNVPYPLIDIEKILELPDPVSETEFVRPSDAQTNRAGHSAHESPIVSIDDDFVLPPRNSENEGMLSKAFGWVTRHLGGETEPVPVTKETVRPSSPKPDSPFHSRDGQHDEAIQPSSASLMAKAGNFLANAIKPRDRIKMPMLPLAMQVGKVDEKGVLRFDNVPQTLAPPDGSAIPCASDDYLASPAGKLWWAVGRFGEPRCLARDPSGQVVARYSLDGRCLVGNGFPPVVYAAAPSASTPIHIVPGPREWFLLQELYDKKYKDNPEKKPHIVWGAQDVDWKLVAKAFRDRDVRILRSKHDEAQLPWAQAVEKELSGRWGVRAVIMPEAPVAPRMGRRPGP